MDYTVLSQLIGSLGFPIIACCVMFKQNSELQKTLAELSTTLTKVSERLSDLEDAVKGRE